MLMQENSSCIANFSQYYSTQCCLHRLQNVIDAQCIKRLNSTPWDQRLQNIIDEQCIKRLEKICSELFEHWYHLVLSCPKGVRTVLYSQYLGHEDEINLGRDDTNAFLDLCRPTAFFFRTARFYLVLQQFYFPCH